MSVGKKTQDDRHNSKDGKYITVSKEGRVCFWKSDLTLHRSELVCIYTFCQYTVCLHVV